METREQVPAPVSKGDAPVDVAMPMPGRLGDSEMRALVDPRLDPRLRAVHKAMGTGMAIPPIPMTLESPYEARVALSCQVESEFVKLFEGLNSTMPSFDDVAVENIVVPGVDGNEIKAVVRKPADATGPLPCIYRIHGGGMVILSIESPMFVRLDSTLAQRGAIVVSVEFRNAGGKDGTYPFPAGLNDCVSVLEWICNSREKLGYSSLTICGESGGANLSIASVLKTKRNENVKVDGVYALCPYISNMYAKPEAPLMSLKENDEYMFSTQMLSLLSSIYALAPEDQVNPLAWPYHASTEQLQGLPPFFISLNELDPLRDEGKVFYMKLVEAGVPATCHIVCGTEHVNDLVFADIIPEVFDATISSILTFARSFSK